MSDRESQDDTTEGATVFLRFGTVVGVAFVVAVIGTAPAALRLAKDLPDAGLFSSWSILAAAAFIPSMVLVALFRAARRGARSFLTDRALVHGIKLFTFGAMAPPFVVTFGAILRAKTHHHALAGVTFAIVVAVGFLAFFAFATRFSALFESRGARLTKLGFGITFVAFLVSVAWVGLKASRAGGPAAGAFLDVLALLLASGLGSRRGFADARVLAFVGPPLAAVLVAFGVSTTRELAQPLGGARGDVAVYAPVLDRFVGR